MSQRFSKNDADETQFIAVWEAMLQGTFDDLTAYFADADASPALGNALWEANAVDVWGIIEKSFFVRIFGELISAGYKAGSIDTYCRILYALFGDETDLEIIIENPMEITINAAVEYSNFSNWITKAGDTMLTKAGDNIVFRTLLVDIPRTQVLKLINSIKNAGTKLNFNFTIE
jgi:hypothetical protein